MMAVLTHLAAVAQVVRHFQNDIGEFKIFLPFVLDGIVSGECAHDVSCDRSGGITVSLMIDRRDHSLRKIILIFQRAVQSDPLCFLRDPAFT